MGRVNICYYFSVHVYDRPTHKSVTSGDTKVIPKPWNILGKSIDFQDQKQNPDVVYKTKAGRTLTESVNVGFCPPL